MGITESKESWSDESFCGLNSKKEKEIKILVQFYVIPKTIYRLLSKLE